MGLLLLNLKTCKAWWKQPRDCPGFGHGLRAGPGAALLAADVPGACSTEAQGQGIKHDLNKLFRQPPKRQATVLNVSIFCLVCLGCVCVCTCVLYSNSYKERCNVCSFCREPVGSCWIWLKVQHWASVEHQL